MKDWSLEQALNTYNVAHWSHGYFNINGKGHVTATPDPHNPDNEIDLFKLSRQVIDAGLSLPVLVRFNDILRHRVSSLCQAFSSPMTKCGYEGRYTAVYPIKVNQQHSVVSEILAGAEGHVGLEAGSKPELMAVLAQSHPQGVIICNGYKDREYIRLALIGQSLGHRVTIVIEKLSELEHVIREAGDLDIKPCLGVRVRLSSLGAGKWQNTGGDKSKFGLQADQVLDMLGHLEEHDMLDCLQLLHFHMGSQISNIKDIQNGMREACRYFAELHAEGANIQSIDVGGGLGIDYEGTRTRSDCSVNYSLQEYANNIVNAIHEVCEQEDLPHPDIITESGRAMTAHHAVLITNVIDVEKAPGEIMPSEPDKDEPQVLNDMFAGMQDIDARSSMEVYHDSQHHLQDVQEKYSHGMLTLEHRARAEQLFACTCRRVRDLLKPAIRAHREVLDDLNEKLADKYFCNFSLFQSMPDAWAIQQVFPIMPLSRMNERPDRRVVIQDLTCDSDGRIDSYVDSEGVESSLPLHDIDNQSEYLIGIFLVGAYQEILGDMHNLFGDTDSVNVKINQDGSYTLLSDRQGDTVEDVLRYVNFDSEDLMHQYRQKLKQTDLAVEIGDSYLAELEAGLRGYTYFEF